MYDTTHICRYHSDDIFLETDNVTQKEKDYIRNVLYREDLMYVFDMDDFNDENINLNVKNLYELLKTNVDMKECMKKAANKYLSEDEEFGLMVLFAYDYFYLTHNCICEYIETKKINENSILNLKNKLDELVF